METSHGTRYLAPPHRPFFFVLLFVCTQQHPLTGPSGPWSVSLVTLGSFVNYWGLILLGLGPYFFLLDAFLVIWQQHMLFLVLLGTLVCSWDASYRSSMLWWVLALTYFAILSPHAAAPPSIGQSVPLPTQKRCAVPSTWRNCVFLVHILGLGAVIVMSFCFLRCVIMLCLSMTNAKMCNGEAVPSAWRNCFYFVDLFMPWCCLGLTRDLFSLFMVLLRFD